jgi:hypothetical protein
MSSVAPPTLMLTDRDLHILAMSHHYGGVAVDHVRQRFFRSPGKGAQSACYARLARLLAAHYLASQRLPATSGIGSGKLFLTPGPKARPVLAKMLGVSRTELARFRTDSPTFVPHHLALCDVRLALEIAAERSAVFTLQEFLGDHELRQRPIKVTDPTTKKTLSFVPDGLFTLELTSGRTQTFLVEMDMATVSPRRCREKFAAYLLWATKERGPILFITLDQRRADSLARYATEEAAKLSGDPTIFWITTKEQIAETTILDRPIWRIVGGPVAIALVETVLLPPTRSLISPIVSAGGLGP